MPIGSLEKRLIDTHRAGVIHLGMKKQAASGKYYPKETDYFVIDPAVNPELIKQYGPEPKVLDIVFTSDDEDVIAKAYLQMYKCENPNEQNPKKRKNYLACLGKGLDPLTDQPSTAFWYDTNHIPNFGIIPMTSENVAKIQAEAASFKAMLDNPNGILSSRAQVEKEYRARIAMLEKRIIPRECHHFNCPNFSNKECKAVMTLSFQIPLGSVFGEYVIRTSSTVSMQNILNCIKSVKEAVRKYMPHLPEGRISGIPMKLSRVQQQIRYTDPKTGKQTFSEHYPLVLEINHEFKDKFQTVLSDRIASIMLGSPSTQLLPAAEAPGAAVIDAIIPDDLYPTREEQETADVERAADEQAAIARENEYLQERAAWATDPVVSELMDRWAAKLGRVFPIGKRAAHAQKFESKQALIDALTAAVGPADSPQVVESAQVDSPQVVEQPAETPDDYV